MESLYTRGFRPVTTPAMEFYDLFGVNRYFSQESMYKLVDAQGRILVLRPDSTIPIARLTATKLQNEPYPIRLCYCQTAYRAAPSLRGQLRDRPMRCRTGRLRRRQSRSGNVADGSGLPEPAMQSLLPWKLATSASSKRSSMNWTLPLCKKEEIRQLIEAKNDTALSGLLEDLPISPASRALNRLPRLFGGRRCVPCKQRTFPKVPRFKAALQELERLYRRIMQADPAVQVLVDFGLVNQAEYYTGVVFRGYLPGVGQPVLSGGRYDRLLNDFGLQKPAIGFAIQLDAVAGYLQQTQPQRPTPPAALVYWTQEQSARGFAF